MKRGQRFVHRHWQNSATGAPLECVVTAVRQGWIFYKGDFGTRGAPDLGAPGKFRAEDAARWVAEVLPAENSKP